MEMNEGSSFIRGVEKRLDSLLGDGIEKKDNTPERLGSNGSGHPNTTELASSHHLSSNQGSPANKSAFISEMEQRFDAIFGAEGKDASSAANTPKTADVKDTPTKAEKEDRFDQEMVDQASSNSIMESPLKDLKSIVLSIEWEINDNILMQFDAEINSLHNLYADDRIILGYLRILRFLGRYVRVKLTGAHHGSIALLLSVYDDLESVILSRGMTTEKRHALLVENIRQYRAWVDNVDIGLPAEEAATVEGTLPGIEKATPLPEWMPEGESEYVIAEPIILSRKKDLIGEKELPHQQIPTDRAPDTFDIIRDMTPHEAFAYALDDIKKTIHAEFSALRTEIRMWRQGQ